MANSYVRGTAYNSQTKHTVFAASDMLSTNGGTHIYSVKAHENRDAGAVVGIGAVANEGLFVFNSKDAVAGEPIFILDPVAGSYENDKMYQNEEFTYVGSGEICRAREVAVNDVFELTATGITAASTAPVVGQFVYWDNSTNKWLESAAAPTDAGSYLCYGQIIGSKDYFNGTTIKGYYIRVLELTKTVVSD